MEYTLRKTNLRNLKKNLFGILKNKICKICFASHVFARSEMNIGETSSDFARSLLDKQHEFNGTSLEVNKIRHSFYLGRHAQQKFA